MTAGPARPWRGMARRAARLLVPLLLMPALLGLGTWLYLRHEIDPSLVRGRIIQEARRATGRQIAARNLRISLFPDLTITADDVALANPRGFSRPAMLTAKHLVLRIALIPLLTHQVIVREIRLTGASLWLDQKPDGRANWMFDHARPSATLPGAIASPGVPAMPMRAVTVLAVNASGSVSWHTKLATGQATLRQVKLVEVNASSTIALLLRAARGADTLTLTGRFGAQTHLWNAADTSPWPVDLTLTDANGTAHLLGSFTNPRALAGYTLAVTAHGPRLWQLVHAWTGLYLPPLADVSLDTRLIDQAGRLDIPRLSLTAGPSNLATLVPGLTVSRVAIQAPNLDGFSGTETNHLQLTGTYAGQKLGIDAVVGPIGRLFGRGRLLSRLPIPLTIAANLAGASLQTQGAVQPGGNLTGTNLTLAADIPNLPALAPLFGISLPNPGPLRVGFRLRGSGGTLRLEAAHIALPAVQAALTATYTQSKSPRLDAAVHIARLDLDALPALWPAAPARLSIIARSYLPFLSTLDGSLSLDATQSLWRGVAINDVSARLQFAHGRFDLDPADFRLGPRGPANDGAVALTATAIVPARGTAPDSANQARASPAAPTAAMAVTLRGDGVSLAALAALAGHPRVATGRLGLRLALASRGHSISAILASLSGQVGLGLTHATLSPATLDALLPHLTPLAALHPLGQGIGTPAMVPLDCLATRFDLRQGTARIGQFLLAGSQFRLRAAGTASLARDQLAVSLVPRFGFGDLGFTIAQTIHGSFSNPVFAAASPPAASPAGDACASTLDAALAPIDMTPALPLGQPTPTRPTPPEPINAAALLRRLFGLKHP